MRVALRTKRIKATVFECRKCDQPIKPGDKYYEWKHNHAPVSRQHQEHGAPKQSELCTGKMSGVYAAIEGAEADIAAARKTDDPSGLADILTSCAESVNEVKDEYEQSKSNMPDSLQEGPTGELIQEKVDGLEQFADALESAASSDEIENWDMDEESPEPGEDHSDDCATKQEDDEADKKADEEPACTCGYDELESQKEEWETERDNKIEAAFDAAEQALGELSV